MKTKFFLLGASAGILFLFTAGLIWLMMGGMPMGTAGGPLPFEKKLAHLALDVSMRGQTSQKSPISLDEANLIRGAKVYKMNCAICHGLPSENLSSIAAGMYPPPPKLMAPNKGVTDDEIGETYWKVKNGIRLTGMPGFQKTLSDTEIWQVSGLLLTADKLPSSVQEELSNRIYK